MSGGNEHALPMGAVLRRRSNPRANEQCQVLMVIVPMMQTHSVVLEHPAQQDW